MLHKNMLPQLLELGIAPSSGERTWSRQLRIVVDVTVCAEKSGRWASRPAPWNRAPHTWCVPPWRQMCNNHLSRCAHGGDGMVSSAPPVSVRQMRQSEFMKTLSAAALMMPLFAGSGLTASPPRSIHQACSGVLTLEGGYYELTPDAGSGLWCDAYVAEKLVQRVLKACTVGSRCHIEGSVRGHGVFYWIHISSVTSPK